MLTPIERALVDAYEIALLEVLEGTLLPPPEVYRRVMALGRAARELAEHVAAFGDVETEFGTFTLFDGVLVPPVPWDRRPALGREPCVN